MSWQDECRAKGGMVTVMPKDAKTPADQYTYIPACRLSNGDGTSKYIDMRNWSEALSDNEAIIEDNWNMLAGDAVDIRDDIVDKAGNIATTGFKTIAVAGAIGLALFLYLEKKF